MFRYTQSAVSVSVSVK